MPRCKELLILKLIFHFQCFHHLLKNSFCQRLGLRIEVVFLSSLNDFTLAVVIALIGFVLVIKTMDLEISLFVCFLDMWDRPRTFVYS